MKELPKTVSELRELFHAWLNDDGDGFVFTEFNEDEWSENINRFLERQGYSLTPEENNKV